ncbi:MAG: hypothetical protein SGPRY_000316 [Prymnesium sp.]
MHSFHRTGRDSPPMAGAALRGVAEGVALPRALLCCVAICLLWATSLGTSQALTAFFVEIPPIRRVVATCEQTYSEVNRQKAAHTACAIRQMEQCDSRLLLQMERETRRSQQDAQANQVAIEAADKRKNLCSLQQLAVIQAIERVQRAGVALVWRDEPVVCSPADLDRARAVVGDAAILHDRAMGVAAKYTHDVALLQALSLVGINERMEYDANYLEQKSQALRAVPQQLQAITRQQAMTVRASLQALNRSLSFCADGPCEMPLQPQLAQMRQQVELLKTALAAQVAEISNYQSAVQSTVGAIGPQLRRIKEAVAEFAPDLSGAVPSVSLPHVSLPTLSLPPLPSPAEIELLYREFEMRRQAELQGYLYQAANSTKGLEASISSAVAGVPQFSDYHPPPVNTSESRSQLEKRSDEFLRAQDEALASVYSLSSRANTTAAKTNRSGAFSLADLSAEISSRVPFEPLVGVSLVWR